MQIAPTASRRAEQRQNQPGQRTERQLAMAKRPAPARGVASREPTNRI